MDEIIKNIRFRLRKAMNGIVSSSMREKGVVYKLNFGVSLPEIRNIAAAYEPDAVLARRLWGEDVREFKILATLLYPKDAFAEELAEQWAGAICHQEIAEQFCANLLQYLPYAAKLAEKWIKDDREFVKVCGFILYARLFTQGTPVPAGELLEVAKNTIDSGVSRSQRAALLALKRYGRQGGSEARAVLDYMDDYQKSASKEQQEFYNDLKFEFEYYN